MTVTVRVDIDNIARRPGRLQLTTIKRAFIGDDTVTAVTPSRRRGDGQHGAARVITVTSSLVSDQWSLVISTRQHS